MSNDSQIQANRRNTKKSTDPRTPKGKAIVSQNAVKHGLLARQKVISTEKQADFDLFRNGILTDLAPESPMESILADRIVVLWWRLKRAGPWVLLTADHGWTRSAPCPKAYCAAARWGCALHWPR